MGFCSSLVRAVWTSLEVWRETQCPFPVAIGILGFLEIFKRCQASSAFEVLNSAFLSSCQRYWRPPVEMRRDSPALFAEQFRVVYQTQKDPSLP